MPIAHKLKLRLFLEGVEVPVIAAQVQMTPNSPGMASIQIPPLAPATKFLPRTLVHLYFLDYYDVGNPLMVTQRGIVDEKTKDPSAFERSLDANSDGILDEFSDRTRADAQAQQYKLLFGGEIVGFSWTKSESQRSVVLQCQDFSNYWDYAYQFKNTDVFGPGYKALFSGGATNLFTDFLEGTSETISRILNTPSVQYPALKGLLGGIVHLLEAIGGSYYQGKKFSGQNVFFSLAELRLKLTQMITAYPDDPTSKNLFNSGGFDSLVQRELGNLGSQISFRQIINSLQSKIFHETFPQSCPKYVPGTGGTVSGFMRAKVRDDPNNSFIAVTADQLVVSIEDVRASLGTPSTVADPASGQTQKTTKDALLKRIGEMRKLMGQTAQKIRAKKVEAALSFYTAAQTAMGFVETKVRSKWQAGAQESVITDINVHIDEALRNMKVAQELELNVTPKKEANPARLNQQIFRPDVWFSSPPRCNVLFPDHYMTLNYNRQFMAEPTRLMLKTNDQFFGEDELFDSFYFAPKAFGVKTQKFLGFATDILEHELFTGILPKFEKMGELNIFAARSGTLAKDKTLAKVGLAQRSANFLYFKYRFAAREMQVRARFNPYLACGFPGLIVDKYIDLSTIQTFLDLAAKAGASQNSVDFARGGGGTHFLGNFTSITHAVSQDSGGETNIVTSYPRQHDESIEFLGATEAAQTVRKRYETDALRSTDVAALYPPKPGSLGPNFGLIMKVTDVSDIYRAVTENIDETTVLDVTSDLPLYRGVRSTTNQQSVLKVAIGVDRAAKDYGAEVVELVSGQRERIVRFKAFRIEEEVPRYRREVVDLPAEEYIRPGWYGDIWHPAKISQAYEHFFGTGSITDPQNIVDPRGANTSVRHDEIDQALADAANAQGADDPVADAPAIMVLDADASIQQAVEFLVLTYSYIKQSQNVDVDEFIRSYTWRPIASMLDMFGTSDLEYNEDGTTVLQGIEGIHSRAFGPYDNLFGLVTPDIESIVGISRGSTVAQRVDTRLRKQDAVKFYVEVLSFARAILG